MTSSVHVRLEALIAAVATTLHVPLAALGAEGRGPAAETRPVEERRDSATGAYPTLARPGFYARFVGGTGFGKGLRLNNPYRLSTELGDGPESLSSTATYWDVWLAAALGEPDAVQHGLAVHGAFALGGISQEVVTPGYLLVWQPHPRALVLGRVGLPIVIRPDLNLGYELGAGGVYLATASLGVTAELIGNVYYGAGTQDTGATVIPILSVQFGVAYQYEVLP